MHCRVPGCTEKTGGAGTKCGSLCHYHWSKKSSSSLSKTIDDPEAYGGDPEFGDPSPEDIWNMAYSLRVVRPKRRGKKKEEKGEEMRLYKLHLPDGCHINDFDAIID